MARPADHVRRLINISRVEVGLGQEVFEISRDGSGRIRQFFILAGRDG